MGREVSSCFLSRQCDSQGLGRGREGASARLRSGSTPEPRNQVTKSSIPFIENRYIYIPLGGTSHAWLATLIVFTFVALWHDLSLKLLTWGWVISLFVLPEMMAKKVIPWEKVSRVLFLFWVLQLGADSHLYPIHPPSRHDLPSPI